MPPVSHVKFTISLRNFTETRNRAAEDRALAADVETAEARLDVAI